VIHTMWFLFDTLSGLLKMRKIGWGALRNDDPFLRVSVVYTRALRNGRYGSRMNCSLSDRQKQRAGVHPLRRSMAVH
jgi:hypothetical protein